jgi:hypothetical protein
MFDPSLPLENTEIDAAQMRSQLTGLFDLIQTIPVGPQGPPGQDGGSVGSAVIDAVNTLNPGDAATADVTYDVANAVLHFTFNLPRGNDGSNGNDGATGPAFTNFVVDSVTTGNAGDNASVQANFDGSAVRFTFSIPRGNDGNVGPIGPSGPAVANAIIDSVDTLNPGDSATVQTTFDSSNNTVHYRFGIPRGQDGTNGTNGIDGINGEVSNADLATSINGTSNNTNGVATLDTPFANDPPTLADLELMRAKVNELILALRR